MSGLHSHKSASWGTPVFIANKARKLLDNKIDLDPASSINFNTNIKAERIYTRDDNGLYKEWFGNVFINPPGKLFKEFWIKLTEEFFEGNIKKAFYVGFSVEQLCIMADLKWHPLDFSFCILRKRLNFLTQDLQESSAPSHGNYVVGIGLDKELFTNEFLKFGKVIHGKAVI